MQLLTDISIRGYKSIEALDQFSLRPINLLVGANGSGKSNFIAAFELLNSVVEGRLARQVATGGGANVLLHHGSKRTPEMSFHLNFNDKTNSYSLKLRATETDGLVPIEERVSFWDKPRYAQALTESLPPHGGEAGISQPYAPGISHWVQRFLLSWRKYHFHDTGPLSALRRTVEVHDNRILDADGGNLAAFLRLLRELHPPEYTSIVHAVQRVAPFVGELILEPLALSPNQVRLEWRHRDSGLVFGVSALSDGTLRFLALAAVLLQPETRSPSIILIDEPELGLHPVAIRMLGAMMRSVATRRQLVVSTQSPLLLDEFEPEDVIVADLEDGATRLRRMETTTLEEWLADYSLGELWEKNELGGRPR